MENLLHLEEKIKEKLATTESRRREGRVALGREMAKREQSSQLFAAVAARLHADFISPRLKILAGIFANSRLILADGVTTHGSTCSFDHTPEFPASAKLQISVLPNDTAECAVVLYTLEILPVFFQFEPTAQIVIPLDQVNEDSVASWLDSRLLDFTDTSLRLQVLEQYQQENIAVDPVCGMRINRAYAAESLEYHGKMYYFCVDDCRLKFSQEPERYLAHR